MKFQNKLQGVYKINKWYSFQVIEKLAIKWSVIIIDSGNPRHSLSQWSVERANQKAFGTVLWLGSGMADNKTSGWANGLRIIPNTKNIYQSRINRTPYEAMFGSPQTDGQLDSPLTANVVNKITTEKELVGELSKLERRYEYKEVLKDEINTIVETASEIAPMTVDIEKHVEK